MLHSSKFWHCCYSLINYILFYYYYRPRFQFQLAFFSLNNNISIMCKVIQNSFISMYSHQNWPILLRTKPKSFPNLPNGSILSKHPWIVALMPIICHCIIYYCQLLSFRDAFNFLNQEAHWDWSLARSLATCYLCFCDATDLWPRCNYERLGVFFLFWFFSPSGRVPGETSLKAGFISAFSKASVQL